jgi:signal transduction histidine kinase
VLTVAVVVTLALLGHPEPSLDGGSGLAITIALLVLVASLVVLLLHAYRGWIELLALATLVVASATLVWIQGGGPSVAGLFLGCGYAATRLSTPRSLAILALALLAFAVAAAHRHRSASAIVATELGIIAFYVLAAFARRVQEAQEQTQRLLVELEASRQSQAEAAALRERSRIAREIHDVLAHSLSGLMLQLEGARMLAGTPNENGQLQTALERAHHLAQAGVQEARRAIGALRDDELPGADRLEQLTAEFRRDSRVKATLDVAGTPHPLDSEASLTLFRVAQEALTNARKHARPERVELHLSYERDGTRLVVEDRPGHPASVAPPGRKPDGPTLGDAAGGYGLTGMRERAELLGGRLDAAPTSDGFRVELWIPA